MTEVISVISSSVVVRSYKKSIENIKWLNKRYQLNVRHCRCACRLHFSLRFLEVVLDQIKKENEVSYRLEEGASRPPQGPALEGRF